MSTDAVWDRYASELPAARRLRPGGKKRILALDGGGVRGIVSIAFLSQIERLLRQETGRSDLVLSDFFDLIGGTSVGSMLSTMLALGMPMEEIEKVFVDLAGKIFSGRRTILGPKRFNATPLTNGVRSIVKDETLGSAKLLCGLAIMSKRVDTGSPWVLSNNPLMPYFEDGPDHDGNRYYKLEALIRASTAAPFLFTAPKMLIHQGPHGDVHGEFVDGGVSPHNNPSYQLLLMAALPAYRLKWTPTPETLLMISVGTGLHRSAIPQNRPNVLARVPGQNFLSKDVRDDINEAAFAADTLRGMIADATLMNLLTMQVLGRTRFRWQINGEIKDLARERPDDAFDQLLYPGQPLLTFQRYDLPMERGRYVEAAYDVRPIKDISADALTQRLHELRPIDDPEKIPLLRRLAADVAMRQVSIEDFKPFL